jgi:hypothetical protein
MALAAKLISCMRIASVAAFVRIPTKPAMHSNMKPATYSDLMPATIPI